MRNSFALSLLLFLPIQSFAQNEVENDSLDTHIIDEVVVDATLQSTSATVSTYIPTQRQKTASQTGTDLLSRMGIPQITVGIGGAVTTAAGQNVEIFIDYLPATEQDLTGMRMADVKKVEYYDYPDDPRFQGAAHVVNFIMQKYEYGGYVKALGKENFMANMGQLHLYSKLQYKKMTYDLGVGGYYSNSSHNYSNTTETYRLPQSDGTMKEFQRISAATDASKQRRYMWPTFKAVYQSEKATIRNIVGANFDHYPKDNSSGSVVFNPAEYERTDYINNTSNRENSLTYSGDWNFFVSPKTTITFRPYYSYSHTNMRSLYQENGGAEFYNGSVDDSHRVEGRIGIQQKLGKRGKLSAYCVSFYNINNTTYSGTANATDKQTNLRIGPAASYAYTTDKFYGILATGLQYDRVKIADVKEESTQPFVNLVTKYSFNEKNSFNVYWYYISNTPSAAYRSSNVIQSNSLMNYTGNPTLTPAHSHQAGFNYTFMPTKKLSLTAFGEVWNVGDRYAYVYEASSTGILRTIQQPVGDYTKLSGGVSASLRLFNNSLLLQGRIYPFYLHDGAPFNENRFNVSGHLVANYYLNNWSFGLTYLTKQNYSDGFMTGTWIKDRDYYWATIGWGNNSWNVQGLVANIFRWNHRQGSSVMHSQFYDISKQLFAQDNHAYVQLTVTYTFGFGKKVERGNEAEQQTGVSSGILK